jgi:hypothetical protein
MMASDFRVTLLGTGVPIPSPDRFGPCTLVEAGDQKFLIDAGRGATIRLYQLKLPIGRIDVQLQIGRFALKNRLPMVAELREFAVAGGLATYGTSRPDLWRRSASYVDKIVRGANPADLPVEQPTRFELVINLKVATAIGIDVPAMLLGRADEVIE